MPTPKDAKTLFFFSNGNTAVTDEHEQIPELQVSWLRLAINWMQSQGVDVEKCEIYLPIGGKAEIFRTGPKPEDWNWRIK